MKSWTILTGIACFIVHVKGKWTLEQLDVHHESLVGDVLEVHFGAWLDDHRKAYESDMEKEYRKAIWKTSFKIVQQHNQRNDVSYKLALNHFADMTHEEFKAKYLLQSPQDGCSATENGWSAPHYLKAGAKERTRMDWRERNIVSPVKNQGHCGSCWTFSTTGALEAHIALHKNKHLLLSEQQLVDCAGAFDNHGCNGGLPSHAFEYIKYNGGLATEDEYPYKGVTQKHCSFNKSFPVLGHVKDSVNITAYDEDSIVAALATSGPVSIAYHVGSDFRLYDSGVYFSKDCPSKPSDVNHAVLAVGFDTDEVNGEKMDYFIVKNSWGAKWGINGYFHIARGFNMCGLSDCASWPVV